MTLLSQVETHVGCPVTPTEPGPKQGDRGCVLCCGPLVSKRACSRALVGLSGSLGASLLCRVVQALQKGGGTGA